MELVTNPNNGSDLVAFNYESITVADSSIGFTAGTITPTVAVDGSTRPAHVARVTAETAQMRYTIDGTAPTTTVGHLLDIGDVLDIEGIKNVSNARFIRTGVTSGTIRCTFLRFS